MRDHFLAPAENQSRAGRIIERLVLCVFGLMCLAIVYKFLTTGFRGWPLSRYALVLGFVLAAALGCWLITRTKASPGRVLLEVMLLSLALRLYFVAAVPTQPASDFATMYRAAGLSAAGDFSWSRLEGNQYYFYKWGYQIPFVLYQAAILWLFRSLTALKLFNVLFMVGTNYLLYRIGKLFLSEKAALCLALIYAVSPDTLFYTTVLTNQHIALFFLLLGVLLLLRPARWWEFALAGLSLAVSDLMRPETVIILAAVLCCGALRCIQSPSIAALKRAALSLAPVLAAYFLTKLLTEGLLIWTGAAPYGIQNRVPEWKFILGLGNVEGYGAYSAKYEYIIGMDSGARRAVTAELVQDLFRRPFGEIRGFFVEKLRALWAGPMDVSWTLMGTDPDLVIHPGLGLTLSSLLNLQWCGMGMQLLLYLLALPAPVLLWKDADRRGPALLCIAVACVAVCVFLLIEIQPRYRLFTVPFWLLAGGVTVERLTRCKIKIPWRRHP